MGARLNYPGTTIAANFGKHMNSAGKAVTDSSLPAATEALVKIWASQINGCARCTDMHTKEAEHGGETSVRLNMVAVWREATVFTEAERAALELTEQGTRIADAAGGATDQAWANAAKHYDDEQLAALVSLIAVINAYNRLSVTLQVPEGTTSPASGDNGTETATLASGARPLGAGLSWDDRCHVMPASGEDTYLVSRIRAGGRRRQQVRAGVPDRSLTTNAGLAAVTGLCDRLGVIEALDAAVGPIEQRDRGYGAGELLAGMAAAQLAGENFLVGLDRQRADAAGQQITPVPGLASTITPGPGVHHHPRAWPGGSPPGSGRRSRPAWRW